MPSRVVHYASLGTVPFLQAAALQTRLLERKLPFCIDSHGRYLLNGSVLERDFLLVVQHPTVFTGGRRSSEEMRQTKAIGGIPYHQTHRGGQLTCHGPGQLVCYPLLSLENFTKSVPWYVGQLQRVLVDTCAELGVAGAEAGREAGVWVRPAGGKIASVGVQQRRWCVMHGVALNVANDLAPFSLIDVCGVPGERVTSVAQETGAGPPMEQAEEAFLRAFSRAFDCTLAPVSLGSLQHEASLSRGDEEALYRDVLAECKAAQQERHFSGRA